MAKALRRLRNPALFVCDLQEKFRPAIHEFPRIVTTTQKMIKASQILNFPIFATTQLKDKLGDICPELGFGSPDGVTPTALVDKTSFSMWVPGIQSAFKSLPSSQQSEVVVVGIESHICVTQTALDLLHAGHKVYVLADGVSSCNKEEVPIAMARLRHEGVVVTTSESFLYECMGDASIDEFKAISRLIKETSQNTREVMQTLCKI